jgi:hypothetical protein
MNNSSTGKPVWNSGTNPWVSFDGVAQYISGCFDLALYTSGYTVSMAVRGSSVATNADVFNGAQDNNNTNTLLRMIRSSTATASTESPFYRNDTGGGIIADADVNATSAFLATDTVVTITDDGAGHVATYVDQTAGGTLTYTRTGTLTTNVTTLGALNRPVSACPASPNVGTFFGGRVYGLVVTGNVLSSGNRTNLITYMGTLQGRTI